MITTPFRYESPRTLDEASRELARSPDAKILAGGHSLIPLMKLGLAQPDALVDISKIASLRGIKQSGDAIVIGALTTHQQIADDPMVRERLRALAEAAGMIGDLQVRSRGTIGGSLAHADPAADESAPTLAFDATVRAVGQKGDRTIGVPQFFRGTFETTLAPDEILAEVRFPLPGERTGSAYEKFPHPASRFAVVGVAAVVTLAKDGKVERAAIGVTGVAAAPFRASSAEGALTGTKADPAAIEAASKKIAEGATVLSDLVASAEYRAHLAIVHARRAIARAVERAKEVSR